MEEIDQIIGEFLVESHENLDRLDSQLLALEADPREEDAIGGIFRTIHTIKGTCGFLGFSKLESVTHSGENLLGKLRDGVLDVGDEVMTALLGMEDAIRSMLASIEATGLEGDGDYSALVAELDRLSDPTRGRDHDDSRAGVPLLGEVLVRAGKATASQIEVAVEFQHHGDSRHVGEILVAEGVVEPADVLDALNVQSSARTGGGTASDSSIRVDVGLLDRLVGLVGELVSTRDEIARLRDGRGDAATVVGPLQRFDRVTSELWECAVETRMQPIGSVLSRLPRMVRDLSMQCGKQLRMDVEGNDTKLDRAILEAIKDPLMHLVRNAVDHGMEAPADRLAADKPAEGRLLLRTYRAGASVHIEVADDGAGIDARRIREHAVAQGVISGAEAARLDERSALDLLFLPGLSTAAAVSHISGRGVGLDVVKTNVERIGGTVEVVTKQGAGTTFRISIPSSPLTNGNGRPPNEPAAAEL